MDVTEWVPLRIVRDPVSGMSCPLDGMMSRGLQQLIVNVTNVYICVQADSGGPVLWMGPGDRLQLVGIISYGKGCATQYPGVNTRVYAYIDWILSVTPGKSFNVVLNHHFK
jgi:secreted trypsin-like serine protease